MMLMLLAAQIAIAAPLAPQSRIATPPPVISRASPEDPGPRAKVAITMRTPGGIVWQGELWVGSRGSSSWRETVSENGADPCGGRWQYGGGQRESSVTLGPISVAEPGGDQILVVNVRWSRPVDEPCGGVRTVELRQPIPLPASRPVTIKGDGGLVVEVRRR